MQWHMVKKRTAPQPHPILLRATRGTPTRTQAQRLRMTGRTPGMPISMPAHEQANQHGYSLNTVATRAQQWATGVLYVAGGPDLGRPVSPLASITRIQPSVRGPNRPTDHPRAEDSRAGQTRGACDHLTVGELNTVQPISLDHQPRDLTVNHPNPACAGVPQTNVSRGPNGA